MLSDKFCVLPPRNYYQTLPGVLPGLVVDMVRRLDKVGIFETWGCFQYACSRQCRKVARDISLNELPYISKVVVSMKMSEKSLTIDDFRPISH